MEPQTPGWLSSLKTRLGLASPNLRQELEEALSGQSDEVSFFSSLERDMLLRTLRFGSLRVDDVMVPRADIIAIDEQASIGHLLALFEDVGHSRIPVYSETMDDLRGMIHIKDLMSWMTGASSLKRHRKNGSDGVGATRSHKSGSEADDDSVRRIASIRVTALDLGKPIASTGILRDIIFVPASMPAVNLLLRMQSTRVHLAMVVDEYGGIDGLVSIEDLIEEVVGEIEDEHDEDVAAQIHRDPELGLVASARTPVVELEQFLGCKLRDHDDDDDIDTLGGLVFSLVNRVPVRGEVIPHPGGYEFEILDADPRRVKRLRILSPRANSSGISSREKSRTKTDAS